MFQWWDYILKFWGFFLGTWLWLVVGFELGKNLGYEIDLWDGRVIGTILGAVYGLKIGTFNKRVIGSLEGFIDRDVDGKCLCFCCCIGYVHM